MKTSKLLISSLLAAAAMSAVPAWADDVTVADNNRQPITSGTDANTYTTVNGQVFLNSWSGNSRTPTTFNCNIVLNGDGYTNGNDGVKAALRFHEQSTLAGTLTIGADTRIWSSGSSGVTENKISGAISTAENATSGTMTVVGGYLLNIAGGMDLSAGALNLGATDVKVKLSDGTKTYSAASLAGAGTLTIDSGVTFTLNNSATTAEANQTFSGTLAGSGELKLTGGVQKLSGVTAANAINVAGGKLVLAGTNTLNGTVTVSGGTLDVSSGTQTLVGMLTTGENAVLSLGAVTADSAALSATGNVTLSEGTIFRIDSYVAGAQLISSSGTLTAAGVTSGDVSGMGVANLYIGGYLANQRGSAAFSVSDSGVLTLDSYTEGANYSLTWNGGDSGVWKANGAGWTTTDTTGEVTFQHGDSVTFGTGTTNAATLEGSLKVGTLTISDATTLSVADGSAASVSASTLSLGANLTLNGGVTLAVTTFASSITQNSTVDYSNLSGTGTLSLGLRTDNGVGFNLSNFEGTIRVERGTGVTAASRFQLNTSTLNANARIVVADGNDLVFNDDTNKNVSNSVTFEGSGTIHVNQNCSGTLSGNVTSAGTLTKDGAGNLTFSGTSNINALSISTGSVIYSAGTHTVGSISGSGKTLTVNGGSLTISGEAASTIGTLSGTGTLTKTGTGTLTLTPANFSLASLKVGAGTVAFGSLSPASFGASTTIEVSNGGNVDFSLSNKDDKTFSGTLVLKNGGKITKKDGSLVLGDVQLGETSTDTVYLLGNWGKGGTKITGALSGAATVYLANAGNMNGDTSLGNTDGERFTISGSDNSYSGTLIVGKQNASTTSATNKTILIVGSETALKNAKVNLALGDKSAMWLGASSVTISGLEGTANSTVALNSDDSSITASTLRVNQTANTTFAGTLAAGIALLKDGTGTLTLSGDNSANSSGIEIAKGVVEATNAAALGAAANAVRISGGQLKVGDVTLNQTNISVVLNDGAYLAGAAIFGTGSGALADGTTISVSGDVEALKAVCTSATGRYDFTLYDNNTLTTTGVPDVTVDGDFATALAGAGWTYSLSEDKSILTISVPEPSAFGLLAGAGALALVAARRRRRNKA